MVRPKKFLSAQSGNAAVIFSIAMVPMAIAAGAGVDMIRANRAQTTLQAAADAAAFAGGASDKPTETEIKQVANNFLASNGASAAVTSVDSVSLVNDAAAGEFAVTIKGQLKTSFMTLAGLDTMDVEATAIVQRGTGGITEVAMVLDNTGSMEGSKIDTLKSAATSLAGTLLTSGKPGTVRVGVVPFAEYVNIGLSRRHEPWMQVPDDTSTTTSSCWDTYPYATGCSTQYGTCYNDGIPYSCSWTDCTDWGAAVQECGTSTDTETWQGAVGSRSVELRSSISSIGVPYPGELNEDVPAEILPLTSNKALVDNKISDMYAEGQTYIPVGLLWGWNMLTQEEPLTEAVPMSEVTAKGAKKVLILMTDGANTVYASSSGRHHSTDDSTEADGLTAQLCSNIKADGILIFTVLFDVTDTAIENMLRTCASEPSMSYVASDSAALAAAFTKIGKSLTRLRLKK